MLRGSDIRLVGLIFHELAHQLLYIKDDSSFNEAFATFVEQQGSREWLTAQGREDTLPLFEAYLQRQLDFNDLLQVTRADLVNLYKDASAPTANGLDASVTEDLRERKQAVFTNMLARYDTLKSERWDNFTGYDNWFKKEMNNARLIAVSTYLKWVPAFAAMFDEVGDDFEAFYALAKEISAKSYDERQALLIDYLGGEPATGVTEASSFNTIDSSN